MEQPYLVLTWSLWIRARKEERVNQLEEGAMSSQGNLNIRIFTRAKKLQASDLFDLISGAFFGIDGARM